MKNIISFYGSHNSALALSINGKIKCVLEIERFCNVKNGATSQYKIVSNPHIALKSAITWIKTKYNIDKFDVCLYLNTDVIYDNLVYRMQSYIEADEYIEQQHHQSHAAGTFYQSSFKNALIFSFDGGGNDGMFNVYTANRSTGLKLVESVINPTHNLPHIGYDLGFPYMLFGHYLQDIRIEDLGEGNLVYPGKIMGLASYGTVNNNWIESFKDFYKSGVNGLTYKNLLEQLSEKTGLSFDITNRLTGKIAYDVAATSQKAFEECFLEIAIPYMKKYPRLPVCISGGCGLNILLNTRLVTEFKKNVFVGPNPNDCGIAVGALLNYLKPKTETDLTYSGIPLLDFDALSDYMQQFSIRELTTAPEFNQYFQVNENIVIDDLINGKIIGVVRGTSEHGPRALGNRSILCSPMVPEMKDILNEKVKNREWYRPFAPVVRFEDVNKYFEWTEESRWMSFCPVVREEWREKLAAVTHVDNTARVQTVTREQNEWLYDTLTKIAEKTGVGVLLNTSFNINGKPILSTVKDAIKIYTDTRLDCLLIENNYFRKDGF